MEETSDIVKTRQPSQAAAVVSTDTTAAFVQACRALKHFLVVKGVGGGGQDTCGDGQHPPACPDCQVKQ